MSHLLHPPMLDEVGLLSAIGWYVDGMNQRTGIQTSLQVEPHDFPRLAPDLETAIFRIVQEALTNVFRHAGANHVWILLSQRGVQTMVTVRDDGRGIGAKIAQLQPESLGVGIRGIKQRAKEFGGELRVSNANPGTIVEVLIPSPASLPDAALVNECAQASS
jgi:signal transduction histidine kinase